VTTQSRAAEIKRSSSGPVALIVLTFRARSREAVATGERANGENTAPGSAIVWALLRQVVPTSASTSRGCGEALRAHLAETYGRGVRRLGHDGSRWTSAVRPRPNELPPSGGPLSADASETPARATAAPRVDAALSPCALPGLPSGYPG
jgi:hypothetical protein